MIFMNPKNKIKNAFSNKSLRWQIMMYIVITFIFMTIILYLTMRLNIMAMGTLGDTYHSNSELNTLTNYLTETEKSLEIYVNYHTFDSIDAFYSNRYKLEQFYAGMQTNPSKDIVRQKEYIVNQLCRSYVFYSSKLVSARRANDADEVNYYYKKTLNCYNTLLPQILELNKLLLQKNALRYENTRTQANFASRMSIAFFVTLALLIFTLLYIIITSLTQPLMDISRVALRVARRDFDVPLFNKNTNNEIGNICRAFDRMIISIREYIDTIWEKARTEAELREKEIEMQALYTDAQLKALQNQINPHFLFNTLNTGAQLAMMEGADKTCYFIEQVSDFFRYNIQKQSQTATIDEELGLVDSFVYIMKVRFGNRLNFTKDIPEQSFNDLIPTMTLQPLVENCIKHGLKNEQGEVSLSVEVADRYITISISDNGSGMPETIKKSVFDAVASETTRLPADIFPDNPDSISAQGDKHTGTGLINVFLRLKLYFHRDDIYNITANDNGIGTKFIIRIPRHV